MPPSCLGGSARLRLRQPLLGTPAAKWAAFSNPSGFTRGYRFGAQTARQQDKVLLLPQAGISGPGLPFLGASRKLHEARGGPCSSGGRRSPESSPCPAHEARRAVSDGSCLKELEAQAEPCAHRPGTARRRHQRALNVCSLRQILLRWIASHSTVLEGPTAHRLDLMA